MPTIRTPLAHAPTNRDATTSKDSKLVNCFLDPVRPNEPAVVKRPGLQTSIASPAGLGLGVASFNNSVYQIGLVGSASALQFTSGVLTSSLWTSVAWSPQLQLFCAVRVSNAFVSTSTDGITWTNHTAFAGAWTSITWSAELGIFCAVASSNATSVMISPDGINWAVHTCPTGNYTSVSWSKELGLFVAVDGGTGKLITSTNGVTWTQQTVTFIGAQSIVWSAQLGIFCVVGSRGGTPGVDPTVLTSSDGITWVTHTTATQNLNTVVWSPELGLFCTIDSTSSKAYTSSDGATWSAHTIPTSTWRAISWSPELGLFCAVTSTSAIIITSPDGITWTQTSVATGDRFSICYSPQLRNFCAISQTTVNNALLIGTQGALYLNGTQLGSFISSGTTYYFIPSGDASKLVFKNNTKLYYVNTSGTVTQVTDPDYPATTVPGIVYMDGYFFVMTPDAKIYNSNLEDPTNWNPLNFLTAEIEPDGGVFLAKHLNYIVAFGQWTTEFFFDNANPVGSPLASYSSAFLKLGCASAGSVATTDSTIVWMSQTQEKGREIHMLNGFQPVKISNQFVDRILNADDLATVYSFAFKVNGHYFYAITLKSSNITLVYDFYTQHWHQWTSGDSDTYFTCINYVTNQGKDLLQHESNGKVYEMLPTLYQDDGVQINTRIVTDRLDGGNNKTKFMSRLELIGDKIASTIQERHSDDDYQTFSSYRTIDLSAPRSQAYRYGSFRRRSFEFLHTANTPLRLEWAEIDFENGTT